MVSQIPPSGLLKFPCGHQSETLKKNLVVLIDTHLFLRVSASKVSDLVSVSKDTCRHIVKTGRKISYLKLCKILHNFVTVLPILRMPI